MLSQILFPKCLFSTGIYLFFWDCNLPFLDKSWPTLRPNDRAMAKTWIGPTIDWQLGWHRIPSRKWSESNCWIGRHKCRQVQTFDDSLAEKKIHCGKDNWKCCKITTTQRYHARSAWSRIPSTWEKLKLVMKSSFVVTVCHTGYQQKNEPLNLFASIFTFSLRMLEFFSYQHVKPNKTK